MLRCRKRAAYLLSILFISLGVAGILLSPSAGVLGGTELKSFTLKDFRESEWGVSIITSEVELPLIQNQRGLAFMNSLIIASVVSLFIGVHLFTVGRRRCAEERQEPS